MQNLAISNFNFSILDNNRRQIGSVCFTTDGDIRLSKGLINSLTDDEILNLLQSAISSYESLTGKEPMHFSLQDEGKFYKVIKRNLRRKVCIGKINKDNKELVFGPTIPIYLRTLCVQKLTLQNETEFVYNDRLYGFD